MLGTDWNRFALQRHLILGLLLVLAAAAWVRIAQESDSMTAHPMSPTMSLSAPLFLGLWIIMMVAMMFPTAAPMILTFHRVQESKRARGETFVATWLFVAAYLVVWIGFGVVAYLGAVVVQTVSVGTPLEMIARMGGVVLLLAGIYQLSPLKNLCLSKCRTPLTFIMTAWRDGVGGAMRMGLEHGAYCLGCCWLLFVILFPLGVMNVAAMAAITVLIFAEKTLPLGKRVSQIAAAALVIYGIVVVVVPEALPTYMSETSMSMPASPSPMPNDSMPMPGGPMPGM